MGRLERLRQDYGGGIREAEGVDAGMSAAPGSIFAGKKTYSSWC